MNARAVLFEQYTMELCGNAEIERLIATEVAGSGDRASILHVANIIQDSDPSKLDWARRRILAWLSSVFYCRDELTDEWWWEMSARIKTLLAVSMTLEGEYHRQTLTHSGSNYPPRPLVGLHALLEVKKQVFPVIERASGDALLVTDLGMPAYIALYTGTSESRPHKRRKTPGAE